MPAKNVETIEIKPIEIQKTTIRVVGDTPLIMHAWSEKAKREILDKQMKKTKASAKQAKSPVEDFDIGVIARTISMVEKQPCEEGK